MSGSPGSRPRSSAAHWRTGSTITCVGNPVTGKRPALLGGLQRLGRAPGEPVRLGLGPQDRGARRHVDGREPVRRMRARARSPRRSRDRRTRGRSATRRGRADAGSSGCVSRCRPTSTVSSSASSTWKRASSRFLRNCASPVRVPNARARSIISRASGAHSAVSPAINCAMNRLSALVISTPSRPSLRAAAIDLTSHCSQFSPLRHQRRRTERAVRLRRGQPLAFGERDGGARFDDRRRAGSHFTRAR